MYADFFSHVLVQLHHQLHVLADGADRVAPHLNDRALAERAERARYDEQDAHGIEPDAAGEEGAQVFHHLQVHQWLFCQSHLFDLAIHHLAAAFNGVTFSAYRYCPS